MSEAAVFLCLETRVQRILPRGEIEALDHNQLPRVVQPERTTVFASRAARLRQLAPESPLGAYLLLMARLADAQQQALAECAMPGASAQQLDLAQAHGMPPLQAVGWKRDPSWLTVQNAILNAIISAPQDVPPEALAVCEKIRGLMKDQPQAFEDLADALLAEQDVGVDSAMAPFVMAALQVVWTDLASRFDVQQLPVVSPFGVCPCCGGLPVASVVRIGGQRESYRYLSCTLCSTEWHLVRVTCSHCESTEGIAYHSIEGGSDAIKAESCDKCHTYRKIFYQEKDPYVEPVADDLASLTLDMLMGEEGYLRSSGNPLLWHSKEN